jgi:hypothetical protein
VTQPPVVHPHTGSQHGSYRTPGTVNWPVGVLGFGPSHKRPTPPPPRPPMSRLVHKRPPGHSFLCIPITAHLSSSLEVSARCRITHATRVATERWVAKIHILPRGVPDALTFQSRCEPSSEASSSDQPPTCRTCARLGQRCTYDKGYKKAGRRSLYVKWC